VLISSLLGSQHISDVTHVSLLSANPAVTFLTSEHHRHWPTGTTLYCLMNIPEKLRKLVDAVRDSVSHALDAVKLVLFCFIGTTAHSHSNLPMVLHYSGMARI